MGRKTDPTSNSARVREYLSKHPKAKAQDVATDLGVPIRVVYRVRHLLRVMKPKKTRLRLAINNPTPPVAQLKPDLVNHPPHYTSGGIETIDFIEAKKLNYNLGNVVKYITRSSLKGARQQDLEKAMWYLRRELSQPAI
jgi:hypothetical protein